MKILHIATGHQLNYQGGIQNYVRTLAEYQASSENEVHVLTEKGTVLEEVPYKILMISTLKLRKNTFGILKDDRQCITITGILQREKYDLIHIHSMLGVDWNALNIIKQYKYVVSLHDYFFLCPRIQMMDRKEHLCEKYDDLKCSMCVGYHERCRILRKSVKLLTQYNKNIGNKLYIRQKTTKMRFQIYKDFLENSDLLLPVSVRVKELYEKSGIYNKYRVLHIGNISALSFDEVIKNKFDSDIIEIAMLGTLTFTKGADLLINIAANVNNKNIKFVFYGKSDTYNEKIACVGIDDRGPYKQSQLSDILRGVTVGVVLSIWEDNAPQVVMEFLNNHIPVIATRMGGIPDFVNEENGYLFDPYNEKEINEAITYINNLTVSEIKHKEKKIVRTNTPEEHAVEVMDAYGYTLQNIAND